LKTVLVCIAKNEDKYINEWVEYHLKLGFDKIFIYENDWTSNVDNLNVIKITYNGVRKQIPCYNDFIKNYRNEYDWAMFLDVDEFLVLKKHKILSEFLEIFKNEVAVGINWIFFGDNNQKLTDEYSVLKRFTKRRKTSDHHIKSIVNLKRCGFMSVHNNIVGFVDTNFKKFGNTPFNPSGPIDLAQINHYFVKTKEEFIIKQSRGRADTGEIRDISDFERCNFNEVDDFLAYNFFFNTQ
jgi:hypothetical protein